LTRIISAVTFDFWNTLYSADNGAMDLVRPRRLEVLKGLLEAAGIRPSDNDLARAYRSGFDAYMAAWNRGAHFGAREQVLHILDVFETTVPRRLSAARPAEIEDLSLAGFRCSSWKGSARPFPNWRPRATDWASSPTPASPRAGCSSTSWQRTACSSTSRP